VHVLVLSEEILAELSRVLRYHRVRSQSQLTDAEIDSFVHELRELSRLVELPKPIPAVTSDPDDDIIVATAVAGNSRVICTRDRHIRHKLVQAYCATYGIRVLTEVELLDDLRVGRHET